MRNLILVEKVVRNGLTVISREFSHYVTAFSEIVTSTNDLIDCDYFTSVNSAEECIINSYANGHNNVVSNVNGVITELHEKVVTL